MQPINHDDRNDDALDVMSSATEDDWAATAPGVIAFVILAVTLIVDAILFVVSLFFVATIFLIFVSIILWVLSCGLTILLCGIGAVIGLIGVLCTIRRPAALTINLPSFLANAGAVGFASWLMYCFMAQGK